MALFFSSPFEDNEGHKANHNRCQDGAVDGNEFVIQPIVDSLLGIPVNGGGCGCGGGGGGSWCGSFREEFFW